jgi:mannosyltransferase OCH1-like enzyme
VLSSNDPIPKIIHLLSKNGVIPQHCLVYFNHIRELHSGWEVNIYNDEDINKIVQEHFAIFWEQFNAFPTQIQRLDIFRIMIVYLYGGFYMDIDVHCFKSLEPLINNTIVLGEEKTLDDLALKTVHHKHALRIGNFMFGSVEKHPFLLRFIQTAMRNYNKEVLTENDILETTGPGLLTNFYHDHKQVYKDITMLTNKTAKCLKGCSTLPSCHFGDYAAHLHFGSWRWENLKVSET